MFSPKLSTVFASRWKALSWAVGILMTAYCSVPDTDETDDLTQIAAQLQPPPAAHVKPRSPWAKDKN